MNLSKIIIALHTINKAKEEVKVLQNCTIKKNIYDKIIHRKDILLQYLIDKKYYSNLDCWVRMKETWNYQEYLVCDEVQFWIYWFHTNLRLVTLAKKPDYMFKTTPPRGLKETMELFSAITYIENFILRHKIY